MSVSMALRPCWRPRNPPAGSAALRAPSQVHIPEWALLLMRSDVGAQQKLRAAGVGALHGLEEALLFVFVNATNADLLVTALVRAWGQSVTKCG